MYTDLSAATNRVKDLTDREDNSWDEYIEELLAISAGKGTQAPNIGTTIYRVWYVAAKVLEQDLDIHALSEADRTKFTGQATPIRSFLDLQMAYDLSVELDVPPGMDAATAINRLCGCDNPVVIDDGSDDIVMSLIVS